MSSDLTLIKELYKLFIQFPFICTDTRKIIPNALFFCLKGNNFDGNLFVNEALEKGARYVICDLRFEICDKKVSQISNRIIKVDNVLTTLQQLATYHRSQLKIPIIGITGTNGKTTTKELIAAVLSKKYKTAYTKGNFNNHIGVPLTLLSIKKEDEIAVIEMGANHVGEIEELCLITQPDYGLITNIGKAHLEGFGSVENIISTKTALYRAARTLFVNADDEVLRDGVPEKRDGLYFYGNNTDISGTILAMNPYLTIELLGKKIQTLLTGHYNLSNILAAAALGRYFNISLDDICDAIAKYSPQNNRSQIINNKDYTIIADYYNANPTSMKAALENFLLIDAPHKWAILGDMLELGEDSAAEHRAIIEFCVSNHLETCFIGAEFYALNNEHFQFFKNVEDFNNHQKSPSKFVLPKNEFILIKGSRGICMESLHI